MKTIIFSVLLFNELFFSAKAAETRLAPPVAATTEWPVVSQFMVQMNASRVTITWKASADESVIYQVEKSTDSKQFTTVAIVMGGLSNGNSFDFEFREKAVSEKAIYRIKQIKQDGSFRIAGEQSL
jgi:hypothetical protein